MNRWLEPTSGRYMRPDPWGIDRPEGILHLYVYAQAQPLTLTDPLGLSPFGPFGRILPNWEQVEDCFYCLFAKSNFGISCDEQAAWLTLESSGAGGGLQWGCQIWPPSAERGRAELPVALPLPGRIFAQAHTHPTRCPIRRYGPKPSGGDKATSKKIGRPIYTISPNGVWIYDPNADKEWRVLPPNWTRGPKDRNCEPCEGIPQP
jgi:hypothetical protein